MGPAGVVCRDSVCLNDSTSVRLSDEQVVEMCAGGFRTGVCSDGWDDTDASVICRQLNLGENGVASSTASVFYRKGGAYDKVNCSSNDQSLSDCEHRIIGGVNPCDQCSTGQFAIFGCQDTVTMPATTLAATTLAATTIPPVETTPLSLTTNSTTTSFEDPDSTTTTDVEQHPTTDDNTTHPSSEITMGPESQMDSQLPAIVLSAVGGAIALLLFVIVALLVIIIQSRGKIRKLTSQIPENRNDLAIANPHGLLDMQDNRAYSIANEQSTAAMYEEISPMANWVSTGELNITPNEAYQRNVTAHNYEKVDEFHTEAISEAYHVASTGATAATSEEISHSGSVNGRLDETKVFTKPNEAYQIPGSAAMIESKENEAYGALISSVET